MKSTIYFSNQCFAECVTPIFNVDKELIGHLDLSYFLQSNISIFDLEGQSICAGKFKSFSNKWFISSPLEVIGELRQKLSLFKTEFEYLSYTEGIVEMNVEQQTNNVLMRFQKEIIAEFKTNQRIFTYPTFELINYSNPLFSDEELLVAAISLYYISSKNHFHKQKHNRNIQQS